MCCCAALASTIEHHAASAVSLKAIVFIFLHIILRKRWLALEAVFRNNHAVHVTF